MISMKKNPFIKAPVKIKSRKNPKGEYANLKTDKLLEAVKQSAHSTHRADLDILLEIFLDRYNARQEELDKVNNSLKKQIQIEHKLARANEARYEQQSKMAVMGEMMDAIAHQWKQPLNALSMMAQLLESDNEDGEIDAKYIHQYNLDTQIQIDHMTNTLSEFRNFFRPNLTKEKFTISQSLDSLMMLVKDEFIKNNIYIEVSHEEEIELYGSKNELIHLILNIINNAKDAFNERDIEVRKVLINYYKDSTHINLSITDSAGGIPVAILNTIFDAEVTTKEVGKGTGIGLYMSTHIAKKFNGTLSVKNVENGASFLLKIPL